MLRIPRCRAFALSKEYHTLQKRAMIESIHNQCISMSAASRNTPCGSRKGIHMEIERKYLVKILPDHLEQYPCRQIEQGYLSTNPVVRIRRSNDRYILTYKGKGLMVREEYNLPLTAEAYEHLKPKADGILITKDRYVIPEKGGLFIELDIFHGEYEGVLLAEVEFPTEEAANAYTAPEWFGEDVTYSTKYHNSTMSQGW